jgi:hypothetical protein
MSRAVWCDDLEEGHVWDERKAIVVTTDVDTFHFCAKHVSTAFTSALNHAEQRGMCEIFVPSYGGSELKTSGPRQRPVAEASQAAASRTGPETQPRNYGGRA